MIACAIASPMATVSSNILFWRSTVLSFPTKFITSSPSRKLLSLANNEKDLGCGFRAIDPRIVCKVLVHPPWTEFKRQTHEAIDVQSVQHPVSRDVTISNIGNSTKVRTFKKGRKNPAKLSSDASINKKLEERPVILYPLATESAIKLIIYNNTLVFVVDECACKGSIKDFVKNMLKVRAQKVNTSIMPDGTKKAYVKLAPEYNGLDVAKEIKMM